MGKKINDEQAQYIVDQWGDKTPEELAEELGVSRATVYNVRKRLLKASEPESTEVHLHLHLHLHLERDDQNDDACE